MNRRDVCCDGCAGQGQMAGGAERLNLVTGRFAVPLPAGGDVEEVPYASKLGRNFEVQWHTGAPVSTVPAGRWNRGVLYRSAMPALRMVSPGPMYDPSDPRTWPRRVG